MSMLDAYTVRARLSPVLLVMTPVLVAFTAWAPPTEKMVAAVGGVAAFFAAALAGVFANVARDAGRKVQATLFNEWGGRPATILLRHRDDTIAPAVKRRYHELLGRSLGVTMPSVESESHAPGEADEFYHRAIELLKAHSYASPLVQQENANYGFRRNSLGLRKFGIAGCLVALVIGGGALTYSVQVVDAVGIILGAASACLSLSLFLWWVFVVTSEWVRTVAIEYGKQLIATAEFIPTPSSK